ncbi:MAG: M23 family metallopeptidase [Deferrisomatales bacterium]
MRPGRVWIWLVAVVLGAPALAAGAGRVETIPPAPAPGEAFWVRVADAAFTGTPEVVFDDRTFPLWREPGGAWRGLAGVDRDAAPGTRELLVVDRQGDAGTVVVGELTVSSRKYAVQHLNVAEKMVTLSPEDQARAAREARAIRRTLAGRSRTRRWQTPFALPVEGPISSPFGVRRVYNGKRRGYHSGLDLAVPRGTAVRSPSEGVVALVGEFFYTGHTVFVDHGLGLYTAYFHLDEVRVAEGQAVAAGTILGAVGSTGRSTGPHLHWGVYLAGMKLDPLSLVRVAGVGVGGGESP